MYNSTFPANAILQKIRYTATLGTNVLCPLQHLDLKVVETKFLKSSKFDRLQIFSNFTLVFINDL